MTRAQAGCAAALALALCAAPAADAATPTPRTVGVQVLAFNDFHGNLEPADTSRGTIAAPGVEYFATHLKRLEATNPGRTTIVSSGDLIGGSPILSALFHDEPTIEAANAMGVDLNAVGNHEFDEGADELVRMVEGGCHPEDGCQDGDGYEGADFDFLAANVVDERTGETLFAPYEIKTYWHRTARARVAYVGVVLEDTPSIVSAAGIEGLEFRDEAETINALIPEIKAAGVETVVVVLHQGGVADREDPNGCPVTGSLVDIVEATDDEVDLWLTGHTHQAYNCRIDRDPVIQGASAGRYISEVDMRISRRTGEPVSITPRNREVTRDVPKDPAMTALLAKYQVVAEPIKNREVGTASAAIPREPNPAGESPLGDVIADAQLAATSSPETGGAVAAFMNPGGIRADLDAGPATYGELFAIQPFSNTLVTMTLTGAQIDALLEQQFREERDFILQVAGITYSWNPNAPIGSRVDPASVTIGGQPLSPSASYRITVNSFLADGGDRFTVLQEGTDRLVGSDDVAALEAYFAANSPIAPGPQDRITLAG